jgi:hypothetical protein
MSSTCDADNLLQGMHDINQVALGRHHRDDPLVGHRRFVDDRIILPAFDASGCSDMIFDGELLFSLSARHAATGTMRT